jgi:hypothetical protein
MLLIDHIVISGGGGLVICVRLAKAAAGPWHFVLGAWSQVLLRLYLP